jgi:hypothetical protein
LFLQTYHQWILGVSNIEFIDGVGIEDVNKVGHFTKIKKGHLSMTFLLFLLGFHLHSIPAQNYSLSVVRTLRLVLAQL